MNNYLEIKKEPVKYGSKISSLALTFCLPIIRIKNHKSPFRENLPEDWKPSSLKAKLVMIGMLVGLTMIAYYANYYVISSLFCPARLSLGNWWLLVPGGVVSLKGVRELWLEKKEI